MRMCPRSKKNCTFLFDRIYLVPFYLHSINLDRGRTCIFFYKDTNQFPKSFCIAQSCTFFRHAFFHCELNFVFHNYFHRQWILWILKQHWVFFFFKTNIIFCCDKGRLTFWFWIIIYFNYLTKFLLRLIEEGEYENSSFWDLSSNSKKTTLYQ